MIHDTGVLRLYTKTKKEQFKKACNIAITNKIYSYKFIQKLIKNKAVDQHEELPFRDLPDHDNVRGKKYYS